MPTIREMRTDQGLSQVQLAVKSEVSIGTIIRVENGKPVSPIMFRQVCKALNASPDDVTGTIIYNAVKQGS